MTRVQAKRIEGQEAKSSEQDFATNINFSDYLGHFIDQILESYLWQNRAMLSIGQIEEYYKNIFHKKEIEFSLERLEKKYFTRNGGMILYRLGKRIGLVLNPQYLPKLLALESDTAKALEKVENASLARELLQSEKTILAFLLYHGTQKRSAINRLFNRSMHQQIDDLLSFGFIKMMEEDWFTLSAYFFFMFGCSGDDELIGKLENIGGSPSSKAQDFALDFMESLDRVEFSPQWPN